MREVVPGRRPDLEEREVEVDEQPEMGEAEIGVESLVNRFGADKVAELITQISKNKG